MDDESKFYALLGRALMDPTYRAEILDTGQQAAALEKVGIEPNEAVLEKLNESIEAISKLASPEGFGEIAAVT
ncbi:MAG: hypothetical protein M3P14_10380 [Chloroflexota bacterium]|nr:hypothetical protein [Chloroflexota bacterium]